MTRFALAAAAVLAVAAGVSMWRDARPAPDAVAVLDIDPARDMGRVRVGDAVLVPCTVGNPTATPVEVFGIPAGCGGDGACFAVASPGPRFFVPARGTVEVVIKVSVVAPGPFAVTVPVYYNGGGLRTLRLAITGIGVPADSPPAGH